MRPRKKQSNVRPRPLIGALALAVLATIGVSFAGWTPSPAAHAQGGVELGWKSLSPDGTEVRALVLSPQFDNDTVIFAGTSAGVLRSNDAGDTWLEVNAGLGDLDVLSLEISPRYPNDTTLFAGTTDGVYRTTSAGDSWKLVLAGNDAVSLAVSPAYGTDSTVFASNQRGVYRSLDRGETWQLIQEDRTVLRLSPNFGNDGIIFAGVSGGGMYRSIDGGDNWDPVGQGQVDPNINAVDISPGFVDDTTLFAGTEGGVYRSTDGGDNWEQAGGLLADTPIHAVVVSPSFESDSTLLAGYQGGVLYSNDAGDTWQHLRGEPVEDVHALALSPAFGNDSIAFTGTSSGVYRSNFLVAGDITIVSPVAPEEARAGGELAVTIQADFVRDMVGAQLDLLYDPSLLTFVDAQMSEDLVDCYSTFNPTDGSVNLALVCSVGYTDFNLELWTVTFDASLVPEEAPTELSVTDVVLGDSMAQRIPAVGASTGLRIVPGVCGDLTGDGFLDIFDVVITLQIAVEIIVDPSPAQLTLADVNRDGEVNVLDAIEMLKFIVGIVDEIEGCGIP